MYTCYWVLDRALSGSRVLRNSIILQDYARYNKEISWIKKILLLGYGPITNHENNNNSLSNGVRSFNKIYVVFG